MAYSNLISALKTAIGTAWPEVKANGIYHGFQLAQIPFERKAEAGQLPLAVMDIELTSSEDWGGDNRAEEGPIYVYYVASDSTSGDALISKLEALRTEIWNNGLTWGQVVMFPSVSFSMSLPVNNYFINAQRPFYAGAVILQAISGDSP